MSKFKFSDWDKSLIALGAAKERRRIRRALKWAIEVVRREAMDRQLAPSPTPLDLALNAIDAATRARRREQK